MSSKFFSSKSDNKVNTKGKSKTNKQSRAVKTNAVKKAGRGK
tara:strand:+ start:319 stop:444 length:126 start_codon:yes stop_codon:yes gene_type:complete